MKSKAGKGYRIGLVLSKADISMSKTEASRLISSYFDVKKEILDSNLLIMELDVSGDLRSNLVPVLRRLAFSNKAFILFDEGHLDMDNIASIQVNKQSTYSITKDILVPAERAGISRSGLVEALKSFGIERVDLSNPDLKFSIIRSNKTFWGLLLWENDEAFRLRKAHLRPRLHPTAMDPRLARGMVNLSKAKREVLDPFCGSGGILIEAGLMGLKAKGLDIDSAMVERAKDNLSNANVEFDVETGDALDYKLKAEAVVTDMPLGKSSRLEMPLIELVRRFLDRYLLLAGTIVMGFPSSPEVERVILASGWKVKERFSVYIHKSYTKRIVVLER